eukprot:gene4448-6891_t
MTTQPQVKKLKGVIFDMDGTLSVPYIDWTALRSEIGCPSGVTIMEHVTGLPAEKSAWADGVLRTVEREACDRAAINAGAHELLEHLQSLGLRLAVVTNNHGDAMRVFLERHGLPFEIALSRDDGPLKPSADLIHKALERMNLTSDEVVGIGDGKYDIEACQKAGVECIYLTNGEPTLSHVPAVGSL